MEIRLLYFCDYLENKSKMKIKSWVLWVYLIGINNLLYLMQSNLI